MSLVGNTNEEKIWNFLKGKGFNDCGVAGLMGNLYAESGLSPTNLQNTYESSLGNDASYTAAVDNGSYSNFVYDSVGYGIAQWTYWSRKQGLLDYARSVGKSIGDLEMQLEYLYKELTGYTSVFNTLKTATSILAASNAVLLNFERPADQSVSVQNTRASFGQQYFNKYANKSTENGGNSMSYTVANLLEIARAELGYHEKKSNANLDDKTANSGANNWTKYARDLANAGYYNGNKNGYAWCDVFADWCFYMLCGKNAAKAQELQCQTGPLGAGCPYSAQYYRNQGRFYSTPQAGDQIFFGAKGNEYHTGIVESVTSTTVTTIEGNTSDCVARRTYSRSSGSITGYGRPKFDGTGNITPATPTPTTDRNNLTKGATGAYVKELQTDLIKLGYSCGDAGADGDFGSNTLVAVKKFQTDKGLEVDGVVGPLTWAAIEAALKAQSAPTTNNVTKGSLVSIAAGATYYSGMSIPSWVAQLRWYVIQVDGDRAVLGKSEDGKYNIVSPVNTKYLTVAGAGSTTPATPTTTTYKTTAYLNLRTGAGTNYPVLLIMPTGKTVTTDGTYKMVGNVKWLKVSYVYNGYTYTGYCSSEYLTR